MAQGLNNIVSALAWNTTQDVLYIGGSFTGFNNGALTTINRFAIYTLSTDILSIYTGTVGANVNALIFDSSRNCVYIGINASSNNILKYTVSTNTVSTLTNANVGSNPIAFALDSSNTNLYIGGSFSGYFSVYNLNTSTLTGLPNSLLNNQINALAYDNNANLLYIGGQFTNGVATYNPVSNTFSGYNYAINLVKALIIDSSANKLYIGQDPNNTYVYDISTANYSLLNTGIQNRIFSLSLDNSGNLYIGSNLFPNANNNTNAALTVYNTNGTTLTITYNSSTITQLFQFGEKQSFFYANDTWNLTLIQ